MNSIGIEKTQIDSYFQKTPFTFYVGKIPNLNDESTDLIISDIFSKLDLTEKIKETTRVLVKPNFTDEIYRPGVTTSPTVLRAVIKNLIRLTSDITIIEGNGGSWAFNANDAAKNHGVMQLIDEFKIKWVNISELPTEKVKKKINRKNISIELPKDTHKLGDILISLPVFKNHCMTKVTLGIKNLWGLVPSELRMLKHSKIDWYLPLISEYYNHVYTIIDGTIALEGNGPMFGDPVEMRTILAGNNPGIIDVIGAWLIENNPKEISHIVNFCKYNHINIDTILSSLSNELSRFRTPLKMKRIKSNFFDHITFKSAFIGSIVFNSIFTPIIYFLFNFFMRGRKSIPPKELKKKFDARLTHHV